MPSDFIPELPSALAFDVRRRRRKAAGEFHRLEAQELRRGRSLVGRLFGRRPRATPMASPASRPVPRPDLRQIPSRG